MICEKKNFPFWINREWKFFLFLLLWFNFSYIDFAVAYIEIIDLSVAFAVFKDQSGMTAFDQIRIKQIIFDGFIVYDLNFAKAVIFKIGFITVIKTAPSSPLLDKSVVL